VPFFVGGDNAFVEGIGDKLTPVALPVQCYAVVKPAAAIATADIFGSPDLVRDTGAVILAGSFASAVLADDFGRNDLQAVAEARCPEVRKVAKWLHSQFGNSRMTGSGSAVFARVGTHERSLRRRGRCAMRPAPGSLGCAAAWTITRFGTGPTETVLSRAWLPSRVRCRGVAKLVKASDFDSDMRGFESFLPCQIHAPHAGH
jgi:hypothetical protein